MNIDYPLASRAVQRTGGARLETGDTTSRTALLVRDYYLSTVLEALAEVPWTSAKRRAQLSQDIISPNFTEYACKYSLPIDCTRPLELLNENPYYIIEGRFLYTDAHSAIILYITNGRITNSDEYLETDDFPEYNLPELEVKFWEYIEVKLASKLALALSGKEELYQALFNEALLIGQVASQTSRSASAAKRNASAGWMDGIRGR